MGRFLLTTGIVIISIGCGKHSPPPISKDRLAEGVSATPSEISGYSGTIPELKDGSFRYWFYSDVSSSDDSECPVISKYEFHDGKFTARQLPGTPASMVCRCSQ